ncbi:SET domain-containing protein SmydA-8 [Toxorhynchites rutilus septentrionalis]|uniref:SET domain-containing protein SmydA-8 n=1 Tax=Toxorhynchites rutilus septentrionalis TaxID=329112 RepID=UPI002479784F|nr:SET domain-containing protein SmydA-8 [Toxorhynchites rutilus septentrionalis]XP_055627615.1 SET domain-containing protein SmydA-8 [Toxorhynchites rutilus septentrionalis]XP_055627616.1 SET domain-containing protein SmydA-8 [Toxorhynchites rutilus septentrionalis]XP_055627617.1 SET domain-containing protein SmydA-8 [Toxorhynchites rutilus septentrionalis]XP_055627618.1 SET domain-containing protein SmydA-8 [Toxorhynchites rutilus septentrionalis]
MPANSKKKKHRKPKNQQHNSNERENESEKTETQKSNDLPATEENNNKPYMVKKSDICGRYLVASRNLEAGTKIIEVEPLAVGPWAESDPVCIGCHRQFEKDSKILRCAECGWRICSQDCNGLAAHKPHRRLECIPLKEHNVSKILEKSSAVNVKLMYEAIFALRCLLLKKVDPEKYEHLLKMDPLNELREQISDLWKRNQQTIVARIRDEWQFEEFSEREIHTVCGIIEVNSFQIGPNNVHARALYPEAFYLMHDCTPNTTHTDDLESQILSVRLTKDLKADDPITLSYSYTLQGTLKRRQHLYSSKFFWCRCNRCTDPTEFGTHCSTLKCSSCPNGLVLPTDPLDQNAEWKCKTCTYTVSAKNVNQLLDKLFKEVDAIDGNSVQLYEEFIEKYRNVLHENHYLFLSAKHSLCQLYGKIEGYLLPEMTLEQVKHKETLCRDLLTLVDKYEPGLSRLRGVVMYELHAPIMVLSQYQFQTKQITLNQLKQKLHEVRQLLSQSAEILSFETPGSPEYDMALAARGALQQMQT